MSIGYSGKIKNLEVRHEPEVSKQTGFPSAATHYMEACIDLNKELITTKDATFYARVSNDDWAAFHIKKNDVLIIDRSITPKKNYLALVVQDGEFTVVRLATVIKEECILWGVITYIIHRAL